MSELSLVTKLKIAVPAAYLILSLIFFIITWPTAPELHHIVGGCTTVIAFLLWLIARIQLGNAFTITPKANYLVSTGLYAKFRHPVYYFSIAAVVGLSVYVWQWPMLPLLGLFIALQAYRIRKEEQLLLQKFKSDYQTYKNTTWF